MDLQELKEQTQIILTDVLEKSALSSGDIFVLGLSSSEVIGGHIGKNSSQEVGEVIVKTMLELLSERGLYLAVQGCEHVNRALVVERELARKCQCLAHSSCWWKWSISSF
mgnify:CR=1 FL=1